MKTIGWEFAQNIYIYQEIKRIVNAYEYVNQTSEILVIWKSL